MDKSTSAHILTYLSAVKSANKELTKKELFKDLLNRLYATEKDIVTILDSFSKGAETSILNIPRKDKIHWGSADTLYNNVIIEFENDLTKTLRHAKEQLAGYLLGQFKSGHGYNYTLIASDFIHWKVFAPDISTIDKLNSIQEQDLLLNEIPTASFTLTEKNVEEFYYYIDRFLFKEEKRKATLKLIEEAFGYQSSIFIEGFQELSIHFNEAKKYGEVQVSYEQWKKFLSIAYGSFDASENNFLIHTYLSIFSKMLAYTVVANDDYISDDEMKGILDGSIFHKLNIQNFVDNDFFHWVKSDKNFKNLKKAFRIIAQEISTFDFEDVDEDVLKGVYQELIDLDTRHTLGEYYTPDWLCERIVQEFDFKPTDRILDPSCGSGSFLRAIIHRIKILNPQVTVEEINNQVYGIDIHPLSVQIAKTTLLVALGKGVRKSKKPIHLNIILANTLLAPEGVQNLFGGEFSMNIDKEKFFLNTQILEDVELFDEALEVCENLAEQTLHKRKEDNAVFFKLLTKQVKVKGITKLVSDSFYKIYEGLKNVKEQGRDSIWKFIVQNLYKPYFLANKFDYIIGNPPWFTYSSIKNEEYQNILNELAEKYQVKPKSVANFPHLEIAAIFYAYCSSYFLKLGGQISFVLPRSFFSADHHDNTRSGKAKGSTITSLWDLNGVSPLFRIPSAVIFGHKNGSKPIPKAGVKGISFSGNLPTHNCNLEMALPKLTEENATWYYVKQGKSTAFSTRKVKNQTEPNPYKNLFKQGATIVPRNFYFIELTQEVPDLEDRIVTIKTSEDLNGDAKMPWKEITMEGRMESRFIFRTALSKSILPFALHKPALVVLPITIDETDGIKNIILHDYNELRREGHLHASKWFMNVDNIWNIHRTEKSQKMSSKDRVDFQRGITEQNLNAEYLVLYNSSAKDANATVVKRKDIDLPFLVESVTYVLYTHQLKEAYYLTAILNSSSPNEMMKDFQARGLFGARHVHKKILDIYYPKFDKTNTVHQKLASLSEQCHQKTSAFLKKHPPKESLGAHHLGKIRLDIKKELSKDLAEIDKIVKKLIGSFLF